MNMLHFSCDLCGKELLPQADRRFVVKIEVFAAHDPNELTDDDLADDQLESLSELLEELEETGDEPDLAPAYKQIRFDLCPACHQKFLRDPLNKDAIKFDFSEN
jgi:hypothetical protein